VTRYEYDLNGNQTALVDAKERRITYEYDTLGNLTRTTYPDGTYEEFTYDANGNSISARDRNGLTVSMTYDKLDRLTQKVYPDGTKETYAYDAVGNVTETVNTSGAKTTYAYDSRNRNISITDALGNTTGFEYDETSRLTKRIDAEGNETSYEYDANGNITKTTDACGNNVTAEYDARNRRIRQKDQNGNKTDYEYDGADRLIKVTDAYGNSYAYTYDANGNLVSVTDAGGHVTRYAYDELGRAEKVTNALGKSMEYTYDATGNVTSYTDYAGNVTTYEYDGMDRLVKKTVGKGTQEKAETEYSYDEKGMLTQVTDKSGTATYQYDDYGRLAKQTDVNGNTLTYTYDKAGRLQSFDNGFGKTSYEYDTLDRMTRVIDRNGKATLYEYDALGNRSAVRYPNGTVVTYAYDPCQRLKEECITDADGTLLAKYSYGMGKAGERTSVTETETDPQTGNSTETEISYEYDKLNRLTKETTKRGGDKLTYEYSYDAVSNRTEKKVTAKGDIETFADPEQEEVELSEGRTAYTYNDLNQLIKEETPQGTRIYTYDESGNLVKLAGERSIDYRYDKENHLVRATIQKGNSVTVESYTYDYAGNRLSKTVNESDTTLYVNDTATGLTQVTAETDRDGKETAYYTRGDELLSMERDGRVWYYLYDGHGDVRMLTDETGKTTDRYRYDAYGNLLEKEGDTKNDFLYTGEQYNANTGLYYLRARYMDPNTGTFISMDSYPGSLFDPVSLHKYLYANADPVKYSDPSGFSATSLSECSVVQAIQSTLTAIHQCNALKSIMRWANITCTVIDTAIEIRNILIGGGTILDVVVALAKGAAVGIMMDCLGKGALGLALKAVMATVGMYNQVNLIWEAIKKKDTGMIALRITQMVCMLYGLTSQCFTGDTLVATETGLRPIEEIEVGDYVWSENTETGEKELKQVLSVSVTETTLLVHITTEDGTKINTTENHPFYVEEKGWCAAADLEAGDHLHTQDGRTEIVLKTETEKLKEAVKVYNMKIKDWHTYYVSEQRTLVHNDCSNGSQTEKSNSDEMVDVELKYKEGWNTNQKAQADAKVKALTEANTVKTSPKRGGTSASSKYKKAHGKESVQKGYDVDHTIDLQLGGVDDILNMNPLDASVNRSLGAQIMNYIKDYPIGTIFGKFTIK